MTTKAKKRKDSAMRTAEDDARGYRELYLSEHSERIKVLDMLRESDAKIVELEGQNLKLQQDTKNLSKFIEDLYCAHKLMGSLFKT